MKKFFRFCFIVTVLILGWIYGKKYIAKIKYDNYVKEAKEGWYVEILTDTITIRDRATRNSNSKGSVTKGEIYQVIDSSVDEMGEDYYWYKIKKMDTTVGWIAQNKNGTFLKDNNSPVDIATPSLSFKENTYHVISIDDINYKHLTLWDDKDDYVVTHKIYHEVDVSQNIDQYWILYTITDGSGKSASKMQKIVFEVLPDESLVEDFANYER